MPDGIATGMMQQLGWQKNVDPDNPKQFTLGHVVSEQGGMIYCADWLRSFISEVPIEFIPDREPFWTPVHPVEI